MGHLFQSAGLTVPNSALMGANGQTQFVGAPSQVLDRANQAVNQTQPAFLLDPSQSQGPNAGNLPTMGRATPQQAAQVGAVPGSVNALSPALTKGGKLATLLMSGLQGALAGRAASEQAVLQSGGHRGGGVGTGFQAGYQLPWQRSMLPLEYQQKQAETGLAQAGLQPVETPYGQMPAALASKILTPYLGYQGRIGAAQIGQQGKLGAAEIGAQSRVQAAQINKRYLTVPGIGLYDTQSTDQNGRPSLIPGTSQAITITPEIAKDYGLPDQYVGKPMKLTELSSLERAQNQQTSTVQGAAGPALVNKKTKEVTPLNLGNPAMGRPLQVGDVNNPGSTVYMPAAQAVASGAPGTQSASVQVPKAAAKAEVPTKIGDLKVSFTTAMQHADLLESAVKALNNGDQQTLNALKNSFSTEFGATGPITAKAIANAYSHEITSMVSKQHMTDAEVAASGATLDVNRSSPAQIMSVIQAYRGLAQSKMNMLNQQKQAAIQGAQPNRAGRANAPAASTSKNDPLSIR